MKETLRRLFLEVLGALSLEPAMRERIRVAEGVLEADDERIDLRPFKKIILVALGKAAYPMARTMQALLDPLIASGVVVSSEAPPSPLPYVLHYRGGHPYPNAESLHAAEVILRLLEQLHQNHLVLFLLSGGGSAIVEKPIDPIISLDDLRAFYQVLVTCGADIVEMNVLRKHFSAVKGGRMAEAAYRARQATFYVSDVPADRPSTVASGPTMPDESTVADCREILGRRGLMGRLPASIRELVETGAVPETPKPGSQRFKRASWHVLLSNDQARGKLQAVAEAQGWVVEQDISVDDRPVAEAAERLLARLADLREPNAGRTVAVVSGGELSSPVTGGGVGGRNQAFVLACAKRIAGQNVAVMSAGTDGIDGNSPAAGAVADGETLNRGRILGLSARDYFDRSDSFGYFSALGDALITTPTGNNVRDVRLLVGW